MKKLAKQILFGLLALALTLSLVACGGDGETNATTTTAGDDTVTTTVADEPDATTTTGTGSSNGKQSSTTKSNTTKTPSKTTKPQGDASELTWAQVKAKMPANLKGSTIVFYNWNELNSITDAQKVANAFTKETNITLDYQVGSYSGYVTEIAAKQAAKSAPDIVRMKDMNPALLKLLQPLSKTGYDFSDKAWDQELMSMYSYKGTAYATNMSNTLMQQPDVLLYNKKLITKYDLDDPYTLWKQGKWSYEKLVEICQTFKDEAGEGNLAYSPHKWNEFAQLQGSDFAIFTENGYKNNVTDPKLADGLRKMIQMKQDGLVVGSYQSTGFEGGTVLFFHDAIIGARKTHFYFTSLKNEGSLGIVPLPQMGNTYTQLYCELEAYAIPNGAKNPAAVPYFLRYWLDADNYNVNSFFANKTVLEVYNWCMKQKTRHVTTNYSYLMTAENGIANEYGSIMNGTLANVSTSLSALKNQFESAVRQTNLELDKIQK
ncbi:MAG: extracellular solute-binding protein [Clostridia bacterium]|nr:extracellular solute-binding protein [Clostridia bacterium]